ncbi:hypothetical protein [Micromonospora sp. CA-246542]|uniref:hypothetical protein n=1 Tax=Micromonospora sp. CA-246542 TaxID=3239959 RepID=UPI003D92E6BF
MTTVHGRKTVVKLAAIDLTQYSNNSQLEITSDTHDVTVYGKDAHLFVGGLLNGTATISGFYDSTAVNGPRAAIKPMVGTVVKLTHQPEGTGSGKPQDMVDVVVTKYTQTHPVADMITWSVDLQFSDVVNSAPQAA